MAVFDSKKGGKSKKEKEEPKIIQVESEAEQEVTI
jgi:hypothetical protein